MPRVSKIRWRDKDVDELQRLVNNFNAKVTRAQKKNPENADLLPDKLKVRDLRKTITTRAEYKRQLSTINRFLQRGSEDIVTAPAGFKLTKYSIAEAKEQTRILNIKRAYERKRLGITPQKGVESQLENLALRAKKFNLGKSKKEFEKLQESLKRQLSAKQNEEALIRYKENYIKAIKELKDFGADELAIIEALDPRDLFERSVQNPKLVIDFHYDDEFDEQTRAEAILDEWRFELD